ncbi:MAG: serine hydrolase [Dehalococcoidia bacterium]
MQELIDRLNDLCDAQPFQTGWRLKDLRTGETADRQGDVVVPSASTRKIAILAAAMQAVHEGRLALDQPVVIQAKYQNNNSGCFQHLQPGFSIQLRDALVMMIIVSDNTCTGTVAALVGLEAVNQLCRSIGMSGTTHRHGIPPNGLGRDHPLDAVNTTTPNDVGLLLERLLQGTHAADAASRLGSTPELCRLALDILSWQKLNNKLPSLLPGGTKVAHKTGTGARNHNDAGIIFLGDEPRFIMTVYTEYVPVALPDGMPGHAAACHLIGRLCRAAYDAICAPVPV